MIGRQSQANSASYMINELKHTNSHDSMIQHMLFHCNDFDLPKRATKNVHACYVPIMITHLRE